MQQVHAMKRKGDGLLSGDDKVMKAAITTEDKEVQVLLEPLSKEDDILLKQFMRSGLNICRILYSYSPALFLKPGACRLKTPAASPGSPSGGFL